MVFVRSVIATMFAMLALLVAPAHAQLPFSQAEMQATQTYNNGITGLIQQYTAVSTELMDVDILFDEVVAGRRTIDEVAPEIEAAIAKAEAAFDQLDAQLPAYETRPDNFIAQFEDGAEEALTLAKEIRQMVRAETARYRAQIEALRANDLAKYDALVAESVDQTVLWLKGENALIRIQRAALDRNSPQYDAQSGYIESNNMIISMISLLQNYATNSAEEDAADLKKIQAADYRYREAIARGRRNVDSFRSQIDTIPAAARPAARSLVDVFAKALDNEEEIHRELAVYLDIAEKLINGEYDGANAQLTAELDMVALKITPLIDKRLAIQTEQQAAANQMLSKLQ